MKFKAILFLLVIMLLTGCSKADVNDLKIYVLPAQKLSAALTDDEIVKAAKTSGRLVFEGSDIKGYNWENHTMLFKTESVPSHSAVTKENGGSRIFKVDDNYLFVIAIKNSLVYYGGFEHGSKNPNVPVQPSISDVNDYTIKITFDPKYSTTTDNRSSEMLYNFFNTHGLFLSNIN